MNTIQNYIEYGIIRESTKVKMNVEVWKKIAENVSKLKELDKRTQRLFIYLQQSAQTNFIIGISKIFETPRKKYPTKCVLKILELIPNNIDELKIQKPNSILKFQLERKGCQSNFVDAVMNSSNNLPSIFCDYYMQRLREPDIDSKLKKVFFSRDKFEVHNEFQQESSAVEIQSVIDLSNLAIEFAETFNVLFAKKIVIHDILESDSYFINQAIQRALD